MPKIVSSSQKFATTPQVSINRSTFDRSSRLLTTFDSDYLVPIFCDEVLPGDTFNLTGNYFGRMSTPINPVMSPIFLDTFYFFVPMRLVWDNAKKFFGEQEDPGDSIDYTIPTYTNRTVNETSTLLDYLGLPYGTGVDFNVLPVRAYWLIFDEWFRDQNLQNSAKILRTDSGSATISNSTDYTWNQITKRGKRHDYFTSCLPWTQKGDPVALPLGTTAEVQMAPSTSMLMQDATNTSNYVDIVEVGNDVLSSVSAAGAGNVTVDLANATGATINTLRQSFQIQKFLERDARGGTRYVEKVLSHFGVRSSDARLQRPEYLGGGSTVVNINPVPQTGQTATTPQGNLAAFGTVSDKSGFTKSFEEHGYIIGLANVRADLTYSQGLHKMWSRSTQYDFYFPTFAHLGEQSVLNKEIYHQGTSADEDVFGYQERWSEYRYRNSQITGKFRPAATSSLDPWHLSEEFTSLPTLSSTFIQSNTPMDRVLAVTTEPEFIMDIYFDLKCTRPMPTYSPPGLIDHF